MRGLVVLTVVPNGPVVSIRGVLVGIGAVVLMRLVIVADRALVMPLRHALAGCDGRQPLHGKAHRQHEHRKKTQDLMHHWKLYATYLNR